MWYHGDGWSNKSHSLPNSNPSWYHFEQKISTGPHDGKSIVRARSRYNALLFHACIACPDREPMICISSTTDGDARVGVPHRRGVVNRRKGQCAYASLCFFFSSRPALLRSRICSRSLSSLSLVTTTLEGAMGMGTDWPLLFSRTTVLWLSIPVYVSR